MKISEAIEKLQKAQFEFGDLDIFFIIKSEFLASSKASSKIEKIEKGTLNDILIWL